jgi:hypothetical protein
MRRWTTRLVVTCSLLLALAVVALAWRSYAAQDGCFFTARTTFVQLTSSAGRVHVLTIDNYTPGQSLTFRIASPSFEIGPNGSLVTADVRVFLEEDRRGGWGPLRTGEGRTAPTRGGGGYPRIPTNLRPNLSDEDLQRLARERLDGPRFSIGPSPPTPRATNATIYDVPISADEFSLIAPVKPARPATREWGLTNLSFSSTSPRTTSERPSGYVVTGRSWTSMGIHMPLRKMYRTFSAPHALLATLAAAPALLCGALAGRRRLVTRRRRARGECTACGYDLRHGSGPCPECGHAAVAAISAGA